MASRRALAQRPGRPQNKSGFNQIEPKTAPEVEPSAEPAVSYWEISANAAGQRLDNYLLTRLKGAPKTLVYRIIRTGEVRINKKRAQASSRLQVGDLVRVPPVRLATATEPAKLGAGLAKLLQAAVIVETPDLIVLDKPAGLSVHGGSGVRLGLIEALRQLRPELSFLELVHRLDKDTSGCILLAKNRPALNFLQDQLRQQTMIKQYLAWVVGSWPQNLTLVDAPIRQAAQSGGEKIMQAAVPGQGKAALTRFQLRQNLQLQDGQVLSLVAAEPVTGRTHQIRVHAAAAGCPLLGDVKYGRTKINQQVQAAGLGRMFLHACSLEFLDPTTKQAVKVEAPLDASWQSLAQLEQG